MFQRILDFIRSLSHSPTGMGNAAIPVRPEDDPYHGRIITREEYRRRLQARQNRRV